MADLPSVLRERMRRRAKTWSGVSYAPLSPDPQAGFPEASFPACLLANSARSTSLGIDDQETSVRTRMSLDIFISCQSGLLLLTVRKGRWTHGSGRTDQTKIMCDVGRGESDITTTSTASEIDTVVDVE